MDGDWACGEGGGELEMYVSQDRRGGENGTGVAGRERGDGREKDRDRDDGRIMEGAVVDGTSADECRDDDTGAGGASCFIVSKRPVATAACVLRTTQAHHRH